MDERTKQGGFDERAALAELERFRQDIERYRARRKAVGEEFDAFIRSFKSPEEVFPSELAPPAALSPSAVRPAPAPARAAVPSAVTARSAPPPTIAPPVAAPPAEPSRATSPAPASPLRPPPERLVSLTADSEPPAAVESPGPPPSAARPVRKLSRRALVGALLLLAIAALALWSVRPGGDPQPEPSQPASVQAPATTAPPAPPPAAAPSPAETALTTIRPVWVRVIADGERVVERELPADARVPLKAAKTIVIRTGDAGAVRLSIAGQDQGILGRDGEVVTRTFTVGEADRR